jgi:magnesium transporter
MSETRIFRITPADGIERLPTLDAALISVRDGGYLWLDYVDPGKEDLSCLVEPLGLHMLSVEDCLDDQQVPKIDGFPQHTFLLFNCYNYAAKILSVEEVDFLLGKNFLITVSGREGAGCRLHRNFEEMVRLNMDTAHKGPDFLLHSILDCVVDSKLASIEALEDDIDSAEVSMLKDPSTFQLADLMDLRRSLLSLRKSLFHEREILVKICRRDSPFVSEPAIYHFRDIYDHLAKFFELVEMNRDIVTSLTEMYLSLINNQMAKVGNRTNIIVRRLTLITTIFMPLTLLAGIGGMSEWSMMTGPENWQISYPIFLLVMVALGVLNYYLLKWTESRRKAGKK